MGAVYDCHDHGCCTVHKNAYKTDSLTALNNHASRSSYPTHKSEFI